MRTPLPATKAEIKPYMKKELAVMYNVSPRCFATMLKPFEEAVGKKRGRYFNVNQVLLIFEKLGFPNCFLSE